MKTKNKLAVVILAAIGLTLSGSTMGSGDNASYHYIDETESSWIDSGTVSSGSLESSNFDLEFNTNWSTAGDNAGSSSFDYGFGTGARIFNNEHGDLHRFTSYNNWTDGRIRGNHVPFRSIDPQRIAPAVITEESINIDYTGDPDDFSWYLTNIVGSCVNGSVASNPDSVSFYGNSLDEIQSNVPLESIGGTGNDYVGDPNRFHMCFVIEANRTLPIGETQELTLSITPYAENSSVDNETWSDPETMSATISR